MTSSPLNDESEIRSFNQDVNCKLRYHEEDCQSLASCCSYSCDNSRLTTIYEHLMRDHIQDAQISHTIEH